MYCSMKKDMGPDDGLWLWLKTVGETNNIQLVKSAPGNAKSPKQ